MQSVIDTLGRATPYQQSPCPACKVRDNMLDRVKATGRGVGGKVSAATVSRELSIFSAISNYARTEFGLASTVSNAFSGLPVKRAAKGQGQKASDKRDPLPPEVLAKTRKGLIEDAAPELSLIWRLVEGTGCRIAEVTGLRVADVQHSAGFPHVRIEPNSMLRLKSESSRRAIPLIGDALKAATEALALPRTDRHVFPKYGHPRGSDAAAAALMKHIRAVSDNEKHVIHSLRHNMKDRLILAEVSSLDQNMILGHAMSSVGGRVYGGEVAKLRKATEVMKAAAAVKIGRGQGEAATQRLHSDSLTGLLAPP